MASKDYLEIRNLINELNKYTKLYEIGTPAISDKEWDNLYFKLKELEKTTGIIYPDSPTQKVHFEEISKLNKVTHSHPMLSLAKTKEISEVENFTKASECIFMLKMDGLTASLRYENGKLISAETRGNGIIGEDITHNIVTLNNVPLTIPFTDTLVIDGEIICDTKTFKERFSNNFANPRNYAAGAIRRLDASENKNSGLSFVVWDCIEGIDKEKLSDKFEILEEYGFTVVPFEFNIEKDFNTLKNKAIQLNYPIDGIVIKYNNCKFYRSLGNTEHHFRGGLAYKFYDEEYETELLDIEWTMGRTGVLTPVAVFKPVDTGDSIIERASLHNVSIMREVLGNKPYKGQKIWVVKQNMIIPQISRAEKTRE